MIPGIVASIRRGGSSSGDPYFDSVVSLLHFDQNPIATFRDQRGKTWTPAGNAHISTDQSKFGGASLRLDGTGDYISTPHSTDFNTATLFTVECWFRAAVLPSVSGQAKYLCSKLDSGTYLRGFILAISATNRPYFTLGNGNAEVSVSDASFPQIEANRWYHIAGTFDGTTMRLFLDGVMLPETHVVTPANSTSGALQIGRDANNSARDWNGWIDDFRFTQGVARYTNNFTPPTAAHPDGKFDPHFSNVLLLAGFDGADGAVTAIDESLFARTLIFIGNAQLDTARQKFGTASLLLDGTGDYLRTSHVTGHFTCNADFTVEAWIYRTETVVGNRDVILSKYSSFASDGFTFQIFTGGFLNFAMGTSAGFQSVTSTAVIPLNTWTHVAASKQGSTLRLFINGVNDGTLNVAGTPGDNTAPLYIGRDSVANDRDFAGHIDELRWTHGVARYISNFTPPALPFPRI